MADPLYQHIADDLREKIESRQLEPGQPLPTELELREQYEASRNAVRDAIKRLTSFGLVETRPGQGTFVVQQIDPFVTTLSADSQSGLGGGEGARYLSEIGERHRAAATSPVQVEIWQASENVSDSLRVPLGTEIISRHERRFIDGIPWSTQTSFYPMEFADRGAELLRSARNIQEGTVQYLAATLGIRQAGYRDWISVRAPNAAEADFFKLPLDGRVVVCEIFRTAFDEDGQPMRLTVTVFPADRNQFIVDSGDVPSR